jgi:hypothetical protein
MSGPLLNELTQIQNVVRLTCNVRGNGENVFYKHVLTVVGDLVDFHSVNICHQVSTPDQV